MTSDATQTKQFGPVADATARTYFPTFGEKPAAPSEALKLALAPGNAGRIMPSEGGPHIGTQGEMAVPQNPRPMIDLANAPGRVGELTPVQGGMALPEGPGSVSGASMASKDSNQLITPLGKAFEPHQPDLFPPNNVRVPKAKAAGEKPKGISDSDWKLLLSLGLGE